MATPPLVVVLDGAGQPSSALGGKAAMVEGFVAVNQASIPITRQTAISRVGT